MRGRLGERRRGLEQRLDRLLGGVGELEAVGAEELDAVVLERVVRGRDHHPEIGAHRAREHAHRRRRHRADEEDVHADRGEARGQRRLEHVARAAGVLADQHPVGVAAVGEVAPGRLPEPERRLGRHRRVVGAAAHAVGAEELLSCHLPPLLVLRPRSAPPRGRPPAGSPSRRALVSPARPGAKPRARRRSSPAARSPGSGAPPIVPMKRLREAPNRIGAAECRAGARGRGSARGCARRSCRSRCPGSTRMRSRGMPAASAAATRASRKSHDVEQHVVVGGRVLHGLRVALRVHQADRPAGARRRAARLAGSWRQRRDVVEEVGAGVEGGARHRGVAGVDRDRQREALGAQRGDHRHDAGDLLLERHRVGAGARRLAADVEDVGALRRERAGLRERGVGSARCRPPSEKLSGVTLSTPMIRGRSSARPQTGARGAVRRAAASGGSAAAGTQPRRGAAAVLGDLGEPERAAGERQGARRPRRRRSAADRPVADARSCRRAAASSRATSAGQLGEVGEGARRAAAPRPAAGGSPRCRAGTARRRAAAVAASISLSPTKITGPGGSWPAAWAQHPRVGLQHVEAVAAGQGRRSAASARAPRRMRQRPARSASGCRRRARGRRPRARRAPPARPG